MIVTLSLQPTVIVTLVIQPGVCEMIWVCETQFSVNLIAVNISHLYHTENFRMWFERTLKLLLLPQYWDSLITTLFQILNLKFYYVMHVIISYTFSFYKDTKCAQGHEIAQYVLCSVTCDVIREIWLGMESFMSNKSLFNEFLCCTKPKCLRRVSLLVGVLSQNAVSYIK